MDLYHQTYLLLILSQFLFITLNSHSGQKPQNYLQISPLSASLIQAANIKYNTRTLNLEPKYISASPHHLSSAPVNFPSRICSLEMIPTMSRLWELLCICSKYPLSEESSTFLLLLTHPKFLYFYTILLCFTKIYVICVIFQFFPLQKFSFLPSL